MPRLQAVNGVQTAEVLGGKTFALRAWLKPDQLAAYGLTAEDVFAALANNNFISGIGTTKGQMTQTVLTAQTTLYSVEQFNQLVVKQINGAIVRLKDVATVALGSQNPDVQVGFDGQTGVFVGIQVAPTANLLDVVSGIRTVFPDIQAQLPHGLEGYIVYDTSVFVTKSIEEVVKSLVEALVIVIFVVFAFLGSPRSVAIPIVAIPLVARRHLRDDADFRLFHQSSDLLALVLAIGLVVDDAIIVVENVNRHIEEGAAADAGGARRRARTGRADPGHDRRAGSGLCADRLPGRPDRRPVHRIRLHTGRRRHGVDDHRADADADDVLAHPQAASDRPQRLGGAHIGFHRPALLARSIGPTSTCCMAASTRYR